MPLKTRLAANKCGGALNELIVADGVASLTVEAVTRRVGCAATSVYAAFGDSEGLLAAAFERYAPLPVVERLLAAEPRRFADFESGVHAIYTAVFDSVVDDTAVLEAMFAEILGKPNRLPRLRPSPRRPWPESRRRRSRRPCTGVSDGDAAERPAVSR